MTLEWIPPKGPVDYYSAGRVMFLRRKHTGKKKNKDQKRALNYCPPPPRLPSRKPPLWNSAGPAYRTEENCGEAGGRSR